MKGFSLILFSCLASMTFAQIAPDSLVQKLEAASEWENVDSLEEKLTHVPDSLLPSWQKIDSIRNRFALAVDSLQTDYRNSVLKIEGQKNSLNNRIDSLGKLNLPTNSYVKELDSLHDLHQNLQSRFTSKLDAIKSKTTGKLDALDLPPEHQEPLRQLTSELDRIKLDGERVKIPALNIPDYSISSTHGVSGLTSKAGDIGNVGNLAELPETAPVKEIEILTQQTKGYQEDIQNLRQGNLNEVKNPTGAIEQQASRIHGIDELQEQSTALSEHKAQLDELADPKKGAEKAKEIVKKAAVNHFAGKEEQLKAAMEKISDYKKKYGSFSSIRNLPKRPPNPMKGKPFVERLIRGLYLQYQQKNFYLIDINPYVGYKISGRITSGIGWNQRYAYDKATRSFNSRSNIFGPRAYVDFKLGKGFIAHVEGESMNTFVPSTLRANPDSGHREWVWSLMTGLKKEYKIYKNLKGTALIQYNIFNRYYKAPYVDRLNSRIGFEYILKQKSKKENKS